jgi:hypothetical protein
VFKLPGNPSAANVILVQCFQQWQNTYQQSFMQQLQRGHVQHLRILMVDINYEKIL